ncbi:hypothetical protein CHU98_g8635 [Xylaria longipes]|nr:hypothetical protein CHU98_g8635 [Xylaria longipes]
MTSTTNPVRASLTPKQRRERQVSKEASRGPRPSAPNAPAHKEGHAPGEAPVASDSALPGSIGVEGGSTNVPGEKGIGGVPVREELENPGNSMTWLMTLYRMFISRAFILDSCYTAHNKDLADNNDETSGEIINDFYNRALLTIGDETSSTFPIAADLADLAAGLGSLILTPRECKSRLCVGVISYLQALVVGECRLIYIVVRNLERLPSILYALVVRIVESSYTINGLFFSYLCYDSRVVAMRAHLQAAGGHGGSDNTSDGPSGVGANQGTNTGHDREAL